MSRLLARDLRGLRAVVFEIGLYAAWIGSWFEAGWFSVRYPGRSEPYIEDQPAPAWLWQLGLGLLVGGLVACLVSLLASPRVEHPIAQHWRPLHTVLAGLMLGATAWMPLLLALVASPDAKHSVSLYGLLIAIPIGLPVAIIATSASQT